MIKIIRLWQKIFVASKHATGNCAETIKKERWYRIKIIWTEWFLQFCMKSWDIAEYKIQLIFAGDQAKELPGEQWRGANAAQVFCSRDVKKLEKYQKEYREISKGISRGQLKPFAPFMWDPYTPNLIRVFWIFCNGGYLVCLDQW